MSTPNPVSRLSQDAWDRVRSLAITVGLSPAEVDRVLADARRTIEREQPNPSPAMITIRGLRAIDADAVHRDRVGRMQAITKRTDVPWDQLLASIELDVGAGQRKRIHDEIEKLPDDVKAVFQLLNIGNRNYTQVAQQLELLDENIRGRAYRAKEMLRDRLQDIILDLM